jgi:hypothetical protein
MNLYQHIFVITLATAALVIGVAAATNREAGDKAMVISFLALVVGCGIGVGYIISGAVVLFVYLGNL